MPTVKTCQARRLRKLALKALGDKCVRCGFSDWRALQFDHINGDGASKRLLESDVVRKYRSIIANPEQSGFQILCSNCNWIKRYENKEHGRRESLIVHRGGLLPYKTLQSYQREIGIER